MVSADFASLRACDDPALVPVTKKMPPNPVASCGLWADPALDGGDLSPNSSSLRRVEKPLNPGDESPPQVTCPSRNPRMKSYSESGPVLEKMVRGGPKKARPYSTGDVEDLRRVTISGFSRNKSGTWMFKVDVGSDGSDSYVIRRRFSEFKELYQRLEELAYPECLPELPHHGMYSVVQMFLSPDAALAERTKKLEELLKFVNNHAVLSTSAAFTNFLGKNPSSLELGYVSLSAYEAPSSDGSFRINSSRGRNRSRRQSN